MQFDDLHHRIFDLAKKGTQDAPYIAAIVSSEVLPKHQPKPNFFVRRKKRISPEIAMSSQPSHGRNLKHLQFTLFD